MKSTKLLNPPRRCVYSYLIFNPGLEIETDCLSRDHDKQNCLLRPDLRVLIIRYGHQCASNSARVIRVMDARARGWIRESARANEKHSH